MVLYNRQMDFGESGVHRKNKMERRALSRATLAYHFRGNLLRGTTQNPNNKEEP